MGLVAQRATDFALMGLVGVGLDIFGRVGELRAQRSGEISERLIRARRAFAAAVRTAL